MDDQKFWLIIKMCHIYINHKLKQTMSIHPIHIQKSMYNQLYTYHHNSKLSQSTHLLVSGWIHSHLISSHYIAIWLISHTFIISHIIQTCQNCPTHPHIIIMAYHSHVTARLISSHNITHIIDMLNLSGLSSHNSKYGMSHTRLVC